MTVDEARQVMMQIGDALKQMSSFDRHNVRFDRDQREVAQRLHHMCDAIERAGERLIEAAEEIR